MSMSSPPRTPTQRRPPSNIDLSTSPGLPGSQSNGSSPVQYSHSRKSSLHSLTTPHTPGASFSQGLAPSVSMSSDMDGAALAGNGLGSLADELADAWDEDEEGDGEEAEELSGVQGQVDGAQETKAGLVAGTDARDSGIDVPSSPVLNGSKDGAVTPSQGPARPKHRRKTSRYDGSDYGDDSDMESAGMTATLEARLGTIESLARRGADPSGTDADNVIGRVTSSLKDLGPQSNVENGATRLITSHTALSMHLAHQTRTMHSLTFALLSPLAPPPAPELIASLLPLLADATMAMPQPTSAALSSLSQLSSLTAELIQTLDHLADTLHMSRQTTTAATRKLKSARDLVDALRRDADQAEAGVRWIERGDWGARLARRDCGGLCRDVVGGFEEVCQGWRDRLAAGAEVGAA